MCPVVVYKFRGLVKRSCLLPGVVVTTALSPWGIILLAMHSTAAIALATIGPGACLVLALASFGSVWNDEREWYLVLSFINRLVWVVFVRSLTEDNSAHGHEGNDQENERQFHFELKERRNLFTTNPTICSKQSNSDRNIAFWSFLLFWI